jgi:hypothetical protein
MGIRKSSFFNKFKFSHALVQITKSIFQIGPFYFPAMFANLNFAASAGIFCSITFVFGMLPVVGLHFQGRDRKPLDVKV